MIWGVLFSAGMTSAKSGEAAGKRASWPGKLAAHVASLERKFPKQIGLYVKDLESGASFTHRADETWYFASGVKLLIAVAVLRARDRGDLRLDEEITLAESDKVDGSGHVNLRAEGSRLTLDYLLREMLVYSDNTASDLLIGRVGLANVNAVAREVPGFGEISTLTDVRRRVYANLDPAARSLAPNDFLRLKAVRDEKAKLALFRSLVGRGRRPASAKGGAQTLGDAYRAYYATGVNSGTLTAYGALLEALAAGRGGLAPDSREYLFSILHGVQTGRSRIRAGLPASVRWAHKTGTQYRRVCDFGLATDIVTGRRAVIAACARGFAKEEEAERALREAGQSLFASGLFSRTP